MPELPRHILLAEALADAVRGIIPLVPPHVGEQAERYAQAVVYGLFATRWASRNQVGFSLTEVPELVPPTVLFLREWLGEIADMPEGSPLRAALESVRRRLEEEDLSAVFGEWGSAGLSPLMHFFEDFLAACAPSLRKARGVWYTPSALVRCTIRAVDDALGLHFALPEGLADRRCEVLDPATGAGIFLAEVVRHAQARGGRADYARMRGYELLLPSYIAAHFALAELIGEEGRGPQLRLANSLQPSQCESTADEVIGGERRVVVVLGNPPYNMNSRNGDEWILGLVEEYKREPQGLGRLRERNTKSLGDDYVKFLRLGEHIVTESAGGGVVAYVMPHGFLYNPTYRGLRWHVLATFDHIYVLDLHGNIRRREKSPTGEAEENIFGIMQGVCIGVFVRTGEKAVGALASVKHYEFWGTREGKTKALAAMRSPLTDVDWRDVRPQPPYYYFCPQDDSAQEAYEAGFSLASLFASYSVGVVTSRDRLLVRQSPEAVVGLVQDLIGLSSEEWETKYGRLDSGDWTRRKAREDVGQRLSTACIQAYAYRPFDTRYLYYTGMSRGITSRPRYAQMRHMLGEWNLALVCMRINPESLVGTDFDGIFCCDRLADMHLIGSQSYVFPLYCFEQDGEQERREYNLNAEALAQIEARLGAPVVPEELMGYIYAALHNPAYRTEFREQLRQDFPRVPYPSGREHYARWSSVGRELLGLHLLRACEGWGLRTQLYGEGEWEVVRPKLVGDRVYVNPRQYVHPVDARVWQYRVGGHRPVQKWLKSRRGQCLGASELLHYRRILHALAETLRLVTTL